MLVAAFSNGVIRLYSVDSGHRMVEITAHGRSISAIDVAEKTGLVRGVHGQLSCLLAPIIML